MNTKQKLLAEKAAMKWNNGENVKGFSSQQRYYRVNADWVLTCRTKHPEKSFHSLPEMFSSFA